MPHRAANKHRLRISTTARAFYWTVVARLIQCSAMADWRQIQARIRKAKTSTNPSAKLSELYQRTRDAMVAWELGTFEEKNGRSDEAAKWYAAAYQRFRRSEWKKKAEEALTRLGVEVPANLGESGPGAGDDGAASTVETAAGSLQEDGEENRQENPDDAPTPLAAGEISDDVGSESRNVEPASPQRPQSAAVTPGGSHKKRRRDRRGGRGRHRKEAASPSLPKQAFADSRPPSDASVTKARTEETVSPVLTADTDSARTRGEEQKTREVPAAQREHSEPKLPSERSARGRAGDPGLASRMAQLESMLRRLLSSPLHRLDELDDAPAGPGVFLLSDSDQVTSYYIESCQTLRIGLGNLARTGRGSRGNRGGRTFTEVDLKEKLAEHLGINQSKVSQYMKDHCVVRWIQLDDDASHLAHFAVGVLRTPLNLD